MTRLAKGNKLLNTNFSRYKHVPCGAGSDIPKNE